MASWVKVSVSDDAADTVIDPASGAPVVVVTPVEVELEHAATPSARRHVAAIAHRRSGGWVTW
jgi:hypothetical protein